MSKLMVIALALTFITSVAFAETTTSNPTIVLKGDIIDNACASANKDNLAAFVKTHTKDCVLMPSCSLSGFSIFTSDAKLMKFDKASYAKIEEFLSKPDSKLQVVVTATKTGDELNLVSIENQK